MAEKTKSATIFRAQLFIGLFLVFVATVQSNQPCALKKEAYGYVCVCNATYCDVLDNPKPTTDNEVVIVSSSQAGLRFDVQSLNFGKTEKFYVQDYQEEKVILEEKRAFTGRQVRLQVNRNEKYQKITGFGGSVTGTVSYLLDMLPQELQDHVYESYYSQQGIGFNLIRMPIGGCDFDLEPWAYNEKPENDLKLSAFTDLDPREQLRAKQIRRLKEVTGIKNLRIKGAAWSSPRWMKSNNKWTGASYLKEEYYQTWADYHVKWLQAWEKHGLPIWAISTGNEPVNGVALMYFVRFMSLGWTPQNQAIWLAENLGPTIKNSKYKDIIIFGNDDQRYTYPYWFTTMNKTDPKSIDYLSGLSVHWYWDEMVKPTNINQALERMPGRIMLNTESCIGSMPWERERPMLGAWQRGEKYARVFLRDLQNNFNGWIDWNIILDENGGPNYVNNTVDAPIIFNKKNPNEFFKQPMFYTIGHFSKFIPENAIRIDSVRSNVNVDSIAFLRPDNTVSLVIYNSGRVNVEVRVIDSIRGELVVVLPAKSIHTLVYK